MTSFLYLESNFFLILIEVIHNGDTNVKMFFWFKNITLNLSNKKKMETAGQFDVHPHNFSSEEWGIIHIGDNCL